MGSVLPVRFGHGAADELAEVFRAAQERFGHGVGVDAGALAGGGLEKFVQFAPDDVLLFGADLGGVLAGVVLLLLLTVLFPLLLLLLLLLTVLVRGTKKVVILVFLNRGSSRLRRWAKQQAAALEAVVGFALRQVEVLLEVRVGVVGADDAAGVVAFGNKSERGVDGCLLLKLFFQAFHVAADVVKHEGGGVVEKRAQCAKRSGNIVDALGDFAGHGPSFRELP